jgi:alkaline phosphatase D
MDRRRFIWNSVHGAFGLFLAQNIKAQDLLLGSSNSEKLDALLERPLSRLAFGSCNYSDRDQSYWKNIAAEAPDLWIWLGDTIYGDGLSMEQRRARFRALKDNPYYAAFRSQTPVIGTWDDHDYASDNQDGGFKDKLASKQATLNFLDLATDSDVWNHSGIYQSYEIGPRGQRTKVILLDLRYNLDRSRTQKTLLGATQWDWFEDQIANLDSECLIIGSSINVTSPTTGFGLEGWNAFGEERRRLYDLIARANVPTILLSGDRHQAEFSRIVLGNGLPVYEFMSSGLTHSTGAALPSPYRVGKVVGNQNYGLIRIEWDSIGPQVRMEIRASQSTSIYRELRPSFAPES